MKITVETKQNKTCPVLQDYENSQMSQFVIWLTLDWQSLVAISAAKQIDHWLQFQPGCFSSSTLLSASRPLAVIRPLSSFCLQQLLDATSFSHQLAPHICLSWYLLYLSSRFLSLRHFFLPIAQNCHCLSFVWLTQTGGRSQATLARGVLIILFKHLSVAINLQRRVRLETSLSCRKGLGTSRRLKKC